MSNVPSIKIGDFNVLATIERQTTERDSAWNTPTGSFVPVMEEAGSPTVARRVWARVQDARPSREEVILGAAEVQRQGTYMTIRWLPVPLDSTFQVVLHRAWGDEVMQVVGGPAVIGNNEYLEFKLERYSS